MKNKNGWITLGLLIGGAIIIAKLCDTSSSVPEPTPEMTLNNNEDVLNAFTASGLPTGTTTYPSLNQDWFPGTKEVTSFYPNEVCTACANYIMRFENETYAQNAHESYSIVGRRAYISGRIVLLMSDELTLNQANQYAGAIEAVR